MNRSGKTFLFCYVLMLVCFVFLLAFCTQDARAKEAPAPAVVPDGIQRDYFRDLALHREMELQIRQIEDRLNQDRAKAEAACAPGKLDEEQFKTGVFACTGQESKPKAK